MSDTSTTPLDYFHQHEKRQLESLIELVGIESISTDPNSLDEIQRCAGWLVDYLSGLGVENLQLIPTEQGQPVVYGDSFKAGSEAPTMLVYGHYDVQPADPYEAWESPPFEGTVRGDYLYGRGTSDMKGQLMAVLFALEAVLKTSRLPLNLKFLLEGQEEIGSRNLNSILEANRDQFSADFSLNPDAGMWAMDRPAITFGLRGLIDFELNLIGPAMDLHSGQYGGTIHNPAQALCELIAGLHDPDGRVTIDGFYRNVRDLTPAERQKLGELGRDRSYFLDSTGAQDLWGEPEFTPLERTTARPTLEVNGMTSGYTGQGMKTIIPSRAMAKISMRLVPDQDPAEVSALFRAYLEANVPSSVRWEAHQFSKSYPSLTDIDSFYVRAMDEALTHTWGLPPIYQLGGGSIPIVALLQQSLGIESILTGYSLPDDNVHSPNEHLHLPTWRKGIESLIYFFETFEDPSRLRKP